MTHSKEVLQGDEAVLAKELLAAIRILVGAIDDASTEVLEAVHAQVGDDFMELVDRSVPGDLSNVNSQRLLGTLWAEFEQVLDARRGRPPAH